MLYGFSYLQPQTGCNISFKTAVKIAQKMTTPMCDIKNKPHLHI